MKYTVKVNKVKETKGNLRGFATVVFGESFKITNIAILENNKGKLFVSMPRYKSSEVDEHNNFIYKDICNPITKEFREELYNAVLDSYEKAGDKGIQENVEEREAEIPPFAVKVTAYERDGSSIKGLARIYLDDCFVINNVSIIQGKEDVFVAMPSYKTKQMDNDGRYVYQDVCFPVTKECREKLFEDVLRTYEEVKSNGIEKAITMRDRLMKVDDMDSELSIR